MNERKSFQIQRNITDNKNINKVDEKEVYQLYSNKIIASNCITNINNFNNKAGITLIALVISIIVIKDCFIISFLTFFCHYYCFFSIIIILTFF